MAQEGEGRTNAHHGFTNKGKDGEKGNKLGIKMHHMELIMGKHRFEESGERGNQASPQGVDGELNLYDNPVDGGMGCRPNHRPSALVEAGGQCGADLLQGLQIEQTIWYYLVPWQQVIQHISKQKGKGKKANGKERRRLGKRGQIKRQG